MKSLTGGETTSLVKKNTISNASNCCIGCSKNKRISSKKFVCDSPKYFPPFVILESAVASLATIKRVNINNGIRAAKNH